MQKVKLKEVCTLLNGRAYKQEELLDSGKYPVLRVGNFFSDKDYYYSDLELEEDKYCDNGDLLFAWSASFGPKIWDGGKVIYHYHIWKMVLENTINKEYLYYYLYYLSERIKAEGHGGIMIHTTKAEMEERELQLPDMSKQCEIAQALNQLSTIIEKRQDEIKELDNLIKARFVELFGDPVSNPKGWEKRALSEEAEIKIGPFGSLLHKEDYIPGGHALINPSHIAEGKLAPDNDLTISDEKYYALEAYQLKVGDVVMGRRGEMGRCAVVDRPGLLCGTGSLLIRSKGDLSADYIQKIISFPSFKRTIEDMAVGQTMPNLNVPIVSDFQIIKPPKAVQDDYYRFVEQVDKSKVVVRKALAETQKLFDSLMQKYFG